MSSNDVYHALIKLGLERDRKAHERAKADLEYSVRLALLTSIEVTEIAELSGISRNTLYRRFNATNRHNQPELPLDFQEETE